MAKFNTETVQAAINLLAENRLKRDLNKISDLIRENRLMAPGNSDAERPRPDLFEKDYKGEFSGSTPYFIFQHDSAKRSNFMRALFDYWLPVYIQEETNAFFNKVDEIQKDVDELLSIERD